MIAVVGGAEYCDVTSGARSMQAAKTSRSTESNESCHRLGLVNCCSVELSLCRSPVSCRSLVSYRSSVTDMEYLQVLVTLSLFVCWS